MRTVSRTLIAGALGLPLLFGAPGVALAGDYKHDDNHEWKHYVKLYKKHQHQDQEQSQETNQSNENNPTIYMFNIGIDQETDQALKYTVDQNNENETAQNQKAGSKQG